MKVKYINQFKEEYMSLDLEPKEVFKYFYEINQIPRGSGKEKKISDYLVDFAKKRNLEVVQDEEYNVIIKKPASAGYENSPTVILQGHMDMVCVKEDGSEHDFDKDPIQMYVEDGFLKAKQTTLGADDGIAVAYSLAILDGDYKHPALEICITTNEETGMYGADALKPGSLTGSVLLNMDSEEEGEFLTTCAGGATFNAYFPIKKEDFTGQGLSLTVKGLLGGHSGGEIHKQRANSNKVLVRLLNEIRKENELRIISIVGGTKDNAIPANSTAQIIVKDAAKAEETAKKLFESIKKEYSVQDPDMQLEISKTDVKTAYTKELTDNIIDYLMTVPDGVIKMSMDMENLVETSLNNAILKEANDNLMIITSTRSSVESELDDLLDRLQIFAKTFNADFNILARYPGWEYEKNSKVRDLAKKLYEDMFDKEAKLTAIHAGVECGLLKRILPDCDMISYGPDMFDVHSPKEHLDIASAKRVFDFTVKLLENLK